MSTSAPNSMPTRFLVSRQSISRPIPTRGLMLPPHPCKKRATPPRFFFYQFTARLRKIRRGHHRAPAHRHRMTRVAKDDGDRIAVKVVIHRSTPTVESIGRPGTSPSTSCPPRNSRRYTPMSLSPQPARIQRGLQIVFGLLGNGNQRVFQFCLVFFFNSGSNDSPQYPGSAGVL